MNGKKLFSLAIATIPLLFFTLSCADNKSNPLAKNPVVKETSIPQKTQADGTKVKAATVTENQQGTTKNSGKPSQTPTEVDTAQSRKFTNTAKFLAGIEVDTTSPLAEDQKLESWKVHKKFFTTAWGKLEDRQLSKVRKWSDQELKSIDQSSETILYPFSGPDFLYAYSLLPKGNAYILAGLEPVGDIPNLEENSAQETAKKLSVLQRSLDAILNLSFFRTKSMAVDLSQEGIIPVLYVFLARTNNKILDVQYIGINKDGTIKVLTKSEKDSLGKKLVPGVRIDFVPSGQSHPRSLYYFSTDLSNSGLEKTPEFNKFVKKFPKPVTYLKAASYLMHEDTFSAIRNLILSQSSSLLQDDSGIPLKYFENSKWNLKFYGSYTTPIDLFKGRYQTDLRNIYKKDKTIAPLDFGIGYQYQVNQSNLMLATPK